MSRTFRNNRISANRYNRRYVDQTKGDSVKFATRYVTPESRTTWHCRCGYCISGWLHSTNRNRGFSIDWELDQLE